jgi:di/tripeptidase
MDIVERFLNYTRINSTAVIGAGHLPSSPGQTALAKLLAGELRSLGLNVEEREHSIVVGTLPSGSLTWIPVMSMPPIPTPGLSITEAEILC